MKRKTLGDFAIEVMLEQAETIIGYNEFGLLDEVWDRAHRAGAVQEIGSRGGRRRPHPVNHQAVVLAALGRDARFEKFYILCCDRAGRAERRVREFRLVTD